MNDLSTVPLLETTVTTLNQVSTSFNTVGGFDKALGLIECASKMITLANKSGLKGKDNVEARLLKLTRLLGDARTLLRFRGSFPLLAKGIETTFGPKRSSDVTLITKLQLISMLIYYPLEHIYWLGSHGVLPAKPKTIGNAALWSCRAWMAYNLLELINIYKKFKLPSKEEKSVNSDLKLVGTERFRLMVHTLSMLCYTYMSVHFSLIKSPLNSVSVDVAGFIGALTAYA